MRKILSNGLTRAVAYRLVCSYAKLELLSGVTTIRTVGGIADFDTRCRDDAALQADCWHRASLLPTKAFRCRADIWQARWQLRPITIPKHLLSSKGQRTEGGSCQADDHRRRAGCHRKGTPGEMKMAPEMIKAVCDAAHKLGYTVAAHTESPEGVKAALENGVDSIEHGAKMGDETVRLYKERGAFLVHDHLPCAALRTV